MSLHSAFLLPMFASWRWLPHNKEIIIAEAGRQPAPHLSLKVAPTLLSRLAHGHPTSISKVGQRNRHQHLELQSGPSVNNFKQFVVLTKNVNRPETIQFSFQL